MNKKIWESTIVEKDKIVCKELVTRSTPNIPSLPLSINKDLPQLTLSV